MASVSLIIPLGPGVSRPAERIRAIELSLDAAGHTVELLAVADPRVPQVLDGLNLPARPFVAEQAGKVASAYLGLREATGEFLVILDLEKDYAPDDVSRVLEPLVRGEADVVVASHKRRSRGEPELGSFVVRSRPSRWIDAAARTLIGITDPSSGLVAVTRANYRARGGLLPPLGSRFVLELQVGAVGRRVEVPLSTGVQSRRVILLPSDVRLIKRLADHRFGNLSRLLQFCMVGASGMVIDLTCYALFQILLSRTGLALVKAPFLGTGQSLDLAVAGASAIAVALVWNFSLNRRLTFNDARQGSILRQFITYALSNALGIALSFSVRLILPGRIEFFARHKLAAAVVGIVAATGISFSMSRWVVFGRRPVRPEHSPHGPCKEPAMAGCGDHADR